MTKLGATKRSLQVGLSCAAAGAAKQQEKDQDTPCFIAGATTHESLLASYVKQGTGRQVQLYNF